MCQRIDIWQQAVTQFYSLYQSIVHGLSGLTVVKDFTGDLRSVAAHHGAEGSVLHPTYIKLLIERIPCGASILGALIVTVGKEAAYVTVEVGVTGKRKVQTCGDLSLKALPVGLHVTGPCVGAVTLLAGKSRTGQYEHAFIIIQCPLIVINTAYCQQRIGVTHVAERTHGGRQIQIRISEAQMVGLGRVHPPAVNVQLMQTLQMVPVYVTRLLAVRVIRTYARRVVHPWRPVGQSALRPGLEIEQQTLGLQFAILFGHGAERGPY